MQCVKSIAALGSYQLITTIKFLKKCECQNPPQQVLTWDAISQDIENKIKRRIQFFMQRWAIPGCSWAVSCNGIVLSNCEGFKDIENLHKMGVDTKMRTGTIMAALIGHLNKDNDDCLFIGESPATVKDIICSMSGLRNYLKDEDYKTAVTSGNLIQEPCVFSKIGFGHIRLSQSEEELKSSFESVFNFDPEQFSFKHTKDTARHYYHKGRTSYPSPDINRGFELYSNPKELLKLGPVFARDFVVPPNINTYNEIKIKDGRLRLGFRCLNGLQFVPRLPPNGYSIEGNQLACCGSNNGSSTGFIVSRLRANLDENENCQVTSDTTRDQSTQKIVVYTDNPKRKLDPKTERKQASRREQTLGEGKDKKPLITAVVMCNSDNIQMYDITHRLTNHVAQAFELFKLTYGRYPNDEDINSTNHYSSFEQGDNQRTRRSYTSNYPQGPSTSQQRYQSSDRPGPSQQRYQSSDRPGPSHQRYQSSDRPGPSYHPYSRGDEQDPGYQEFSDQESCSQPFGSYEEANLGDLPFESLDWAAE